MNKLYSPIISLLKRLYNPRLPRPLRGLAMTVWVVIASVAKQSIISLCLAAPLSALPHKTELKNCKAALLAQLNEHKRLPAKGCPVSQKLIVWLGILRDVNQFSPQELADFLNANLHWPQHDKLCRKAEEIMAKQGSPEEILFWFEKHPPQTPLGALAFAKVLMRLKEKTKAAKVIVAAWRSLDMTKSEESKFVQFFGHLLQEKEHLARLTTLLWEEDIPAAKRLLAHVPITARKVAEVRLAFLEGKTNAPDNMKALPAQLRKNEGLLYESTRWHRKQDNVQEATQLLLTTAISSSQAHKWWKERSYIARELIALGDYKTAYKVLKNHRLKPGTEDFANAEFLMGWLALRFLNRPDEAKHHFETLLANVTGAISKARGAYWMGRVHEAKHNKKQAVAFYKKAAKYKTTYYGQLAAEKLHEKPAPYLAKATSATAAERAAFEQKDSVQAARILKGLGAGASHELSKFLLQIADEADTKAEREMSVLLAHALSPYDVVWAAKKAGYREPVPLAKAYPTCKIPKRGQKIPEKAFVMAIIYQESRFNPTVVSTANAMGLMQFISTTAAREAKRLKIKHTDKKLFDPQYNLTLGSSHLSHLLDKFDNSYILAAAAYNAGPTPVARWVEKNGHPKAKGVDVVDWVELIPYSQTRDYVMRVMENVTIYRAALQ